MKLKAFTLAEVLITLAVIGIVASMTIPALMNSTDNKQLEVAWKKAYVSLAAFQKDLQKDNELPILSTDLNKESRFRDYFSISKYCTQPQAQGCWHTTGSWYTLAGKTVANNMDLGGRGFITNDGAMYLVYGAVGGTNCTAKGAVSYSGFSSRDCWLLMVDVNGKKGPNTNGRDIFGVEMLEDQIIPLGNSGSFLTNTNYCNNTNTSTWYTYGLGCSQKAILGETY